MLSALLVQLFGREVVDRLAAAGFEDAESIASAGPERLSDEAGLSLALSRRIVAVALEDAGDADPEASTEPGAAIEPVATIEPEAVFEPVAVHEPATVNDPAAAAGPNAATPRGSDSPEPGERHVRRPFRRPHSPLASSPAEKSSTGARGTAATVGQTGQSRAGRRKDRVKNREPEEDRDRQRKREQPATDPDPFVDDVGLVAWMGSASRQGSSPGSSFAVADEILDPGPPHPPEAGWPASSPAPEPPATVEKRADGPIRAGVAVTVLVDGSFWSFGAPIEGKIVAPTSVGEADGAKATTDGTDDGSAPRDPQPSPRRRMHDGH